jgi:hypothetical protein
MADEQNHYVSHLNKIRKLWVAIIPEEKKAVLKTYSKEERLIKYQKIDQDIFDTNIKLLHNERQKQGKVNTDAVLNDAVKLVIANLEIN